ncbi:MAG TPA: VRR-NUC domain-containing protein, partial [Xylella sp.]
VELKAPGEQCRPHQRREHERMRRMGQRVVVIDSFNGVDEVLA